MNKINVILADDHAVVRMGFRLLLQDTKDITVAGEAESGEEVLKLLNTLTADIIVMDLSMPGIGGLETISRIVSKNKPPKILILSAHEDAIHPKRSLKAGASGYTTWQPDTYTLATFPRLAESRSAATGRAPLRAH